MQERTREGQALAITEVVKSYGSVRALDGVSISVPYGEFVALLGPNGAGKTTLFQVLTGLFVPDSGVIEIARHDIRENAVPALGSLGIVFQAPTLDPELSILANLRFHTDLQGMPRRVANQRIASELDRFALADRRKDPVRNLSGGNRRRVELARSLLHDPAILLMDEPTVGLDPQSRRDILSTVLQLRRERRIAVLWATHLVDEAEKADRAVILHRGRVLVDGTAEAILKRTNAASLSDAFFSLTRDPEEAAAA
jgi:ABC-2 type transport system ATP-binding protein